MATILKQSTQIVVRVGPFVDVADGFTPETGVTLSGADEAELLKAAGAATVSIASNTWATITGADGWYDLTLSTTDTNTIGELVVVVHDDSVCLPVFARFQVVEEAIYDALFASGATAPATASALSTAQTDLDTITGSDGVTLATAQGLYAPSKAGDAMALTSGERTTLTAAIWAAATSGLTTAGSIGKKLADWTIHSAADVWAVATRVLTANTNLNDPTAAAIADAVWDEARAGHVSAGTFGEGVKVESLNTQAKADVNAEADTALTDYGANTTTPPTVGAIADAVWDEAVAGHVSAGTFGATDAAILADTNELQTDWANGGRLDLILDTAAAGGGSSVPDIIGIVTRAGSTYYCSWILRVSGAMVTSGLSSLVTTFYDEDGTDMTFSGTPTESGGFMYATGTLGTALTDNRPLLVKVGATYGGTAYSTVLPAVSVETA